MITPLVLLTIHAILAGTLLENGDFEKGLQGWNVQNSWYEKPKGAGLATPVLTPGEGRQGSKALKIVGNGRRGIAIQAPAAYPGRYRVTGWIKCQDIEAGKARVLLEWIDGKHKWMRGDPAVQVSGTHDWQPFDAVLEAPAGTRSVHFDLLTTDANHGTVWFDDLTLERLPSNLPPPQAPKLSAGTPAGGEDCLEIVWDPKKLVPGTCRLLIYAKLGAAGKKGDGRKGDRHHLCEAPSGPFRQMVPVTNGTVDECNGLQGKGKERDAN